jgi:transmembrane sensor
VADERSRQLASAAEHIDAEFGSVRVEHGVKALEHRIARRQAVRRGLVAVSASAVLVLGLWLARGPLHFAAPTHVADVLRVETRDGSAAQGLGQDSALALERDVPDEVALRLVRGKGHFEVKPNKQRRYHVRAGEVEVEVLGTAFVVERVEEKRARVRVEHGVVKVAWLDGSTMLRAGEEGVFPPVVSAPAPVVAAPSAAEPPSAVAESAPDTEATTPERGERWRTLARAGKHQEAFGSIGHKPIDDLSGLLLAADAARLSGHPREAVGYLERLIARYPRSTSAHLSAFTLGRLALYELNQPALAAESFAQAYQLNRNGPLAEDALAREAEAYHRAGDDERAKRAAGRYLQRYPRGARRAELLRYTETGSTAPSQ